METFLFFFICSCTFGGSFGLRRVYPIFQTIPVSGQVGDPVYLTSYIESGKIREGQDAAQVHLPKASAGSYAGYFTVNKKHNSNLFFWFFPAKVNPDNAPVVVWLQGGPGATSMYGLFTEHGPFYINQQGELHSRRYTWATQFNMIYIDSPVGTGFSFTDHEDGYANDQAAVGRDLYSAISQFFQLFPKLRKNDFFVTGESYGGKYVPALSYTIHKNNQINPDKINLKGLAIGNGWTVPQYMLEYGEYLYQIGLIDEKEKKSFDKAKTEALEYVKNGDYFKANQIVDELLGGDATAYKSFFYNVTGYELYFNYLHHKEYTTYGDMGKYLQSDVVRRAIHVGNKPFQNGDITAKHLFSDVMRSIQPWLEELMENYRVLFYNGQLDIICSYPLTVNVLRNLDWSGAEEYKSAPRNQWMVGDQLAGYYRTVKGMTEVLVRNAGHMVPTDQPKWSLDLITRFVFDKPFH